MKTTPSKKRAERYRPFVEEDTTKKKARKLARLVSEFLEKELDRQALIDEPSKLFEVKSLLDECLWEETMYPYDPHFIFEYDIDEDNRDFYSPELNEESRRADHAALTDGILIIQSNLRDNFWEPFKEKINAFRGVVQKPKNITQVKDEPQNEQSKPINPEDYKVLDDYGYSPQRDGMHSYLNVSMPSQVKIYYTLENDVIQFFNNGINEIHALIELVKDLPVSIFRQCKDEACGRWFIVTSKHKREFCSRNCAARYNQRVFRESDREAHREYHRNYRHL
jgi:hypothetical protein